MPTISIDIYSDTLCPWSYIGKRYLDNAISTYTSDHPETKFELTWHTFLLHPGSRASGISKRSYFSAKYGPRAETFLAKVEATGEPLGITFDWEGTSGSTYDSQILVLAAEKWEVQSRLLDLLFKGHLEERRDIADRGFLVECAIEAGLVGSEKEGLRLLDDEGLGRRVEEANTMARARGVVAVPSYLVQGRWFVGGTQRCEIFLDLFRRVAGETGDGRVILVSAGKRRP